MIKMDPASRDAITNHHINAQRAATAAKKGDGIPWQFPNPTTLAYLLGEDILVHPITMDVENRTTTAVVRVAFPEVKDVIPSTKVAAGTVWLDWWEPTNSKKAHAAGETTVSVVPITSFPVYVRKGAFIPLHPLNYARQDLSVEDLLLESSTHVGMDTVHFTWFAPGPGQAAEYVLRESVSEGTGMVADASFIDGIINAEISAHAGSLGAGFAFVGVSKPTEVTVKAWPNSHCVHEYAEHTSTFTVSCASVAGGLRITASGVTSTF